MEHSRRIVVSATLPPAAVSGASSSGSTVNRAGCSMKVWTCVDKSNRPFATSQNYKYGPPVATVCASMVSEPAQQAPTAPVRAAFPSARPGTVRS